MANLACSISAQSLDWGRSVNGALTENAFATSIDGQNSVWTAGIFVNTVDLDPGAGTFNVSSNGDHDIFIQKLDSAGNFQWGGSLGVSGAEYGRSIVIDAQDNMYLTGRVRGTVDLDPGPGTDFQTTPNTVFAAFVIKLSASGSYQWGRIFGGLGNDEGYGIAIDGQGNLITVGALGNGGDLDPGPGTATVAGMGQQDAFVQKMDSNGNFLWGFTVGGTAQDIAYAVCVDALDNLIVTGEFRNSVDLDPGPGVATRTSGGDADIFVLKLSSSGAFIWGHGIGASGNERGKAIGVGPDGGPVLTGRITSSTDFDPGPGVLSLAGDFTEPAFVCKLSSDGSLTWAFMLKSFLNEGLSLKVDALNRITICGVFGSFGSTALDLDPGPGTLELLTNGGGDCFVASYTANGTVIFGFGFGSAQNDVANALALGTQGRFVVAGAYLQTMDADPGPGVSLLTNAGSTDAFVIQYRKPDCAGIFVRAKAFLEGAYDTGSFLPQRDDLRLAGLIPLNEPYSDLGFVLEQDASTTQQALTWTLSSAIVDWVMVELRVADDPSVVIARRAALLQRDGDIVAVDGVAPVGFCAGDGEYHIAIRHRNHLAVMTAQPVALSGTPAVIDFTSPAAPTWGTEARKLIGDDMVLWAGNVEPDGALRYIGQQNDRDPILVRVGGSIPTNTTSGYWPEDVNLDGVVKYVGQQNDRDPILLNIGGSTPTATRVQQLP
ncbi:MAG: hypothetical protein IPK70_00475 [Flavobacteriales bacterium]|jgi:hypothetical protein|nr:hypothetical protein [Flavobacteriales bacterium]